MLNKVDLVRASASMPYVLKDCLLSGMKLLDGGCTDSIPVKAMQDLGYRRTVVVLTRQDGYVKEPENTRLINCSTTDIRCFKWHFDAAINPITEPWRQFAEWSRLEKSL
jgi:predicted patatin/cPLA2 family phospholipase